ncbi:MAG: DUF86 domain-containing protein [Pseudomonadota bacterium]|nr:DUF86 domain-containing protein [Pseudomonadota bacterium]
MTLHRTADYLDHMLEAAQQACLYVQGLGKADFLEDKRTQQAVILNLLILGEAVTKLLSQDESFAARHPQVPWRSMKGMRNRLAHGYFDINLDVVWDTVQTALPRLLAQLPAIRDAAAAENENGSGE